MIESSLERLARIESRHPLAVLGIFAVITIVLMSGFAFIESDTSFENFVPEDVEAIKSLTEIRDNLGTGTTTIIFIFTTDKSDPAALEDMRDVRMLRAIDIITQKAETNEFVTGSSSIIDLVKTEDGFPEQAEINSILDGSSESMLSDDYSITVARVILSDGLSLEQQANVLKEMRDIIRFSEKPLGMEVKLAGIIVQDQEVGETIGSSLGFVTLLGFAAVFVILYILFRRVVIVGVAVIPVGFGIVWTYGALGWIGIPLSTALVGIFSMIIGIGIDFAIHIIHRFDEEAKKGSVEKALSLAVKNVGRGLTLTTITTIIGFLSLLAAVLPVLQDMAIALSIGVFSSFLATIGMIPPILAITERRRRKKKRKI